MSDADDSTTAAEDVGAFAGPPESHRLSCLEVWGGNEATDSLVQTTGLDAHAFSRPYGGHVGGGDVLHVTACSSGRITRALLADVAGHGEMVAGTALGLRQLMDRSVDILDQSKLVRELNDGFSKLEGRFASALVVSYFRPTGALTVCNAGHPPPLYFSVRRGAWSYLEAHYDSAAKDSPSNLPLGMFGSVAYELQQVDFEAGDLILLYTDGVIEAAGADDEQFGSGRLLDLVNRLGPSGVVEVIPRVLAVIEEWVGSTGLDDDVSLMVFGRNELKASLRDDALAPLRFLQHKLTRPSVG